MADKVGAIKRAPRPGHPTPPCGGSGVFHAVCRQNAGPTSPRGEGSEVAAIAECARLPWVAVGCQRNFLAPLGLRLLRPALSVSRAGAVTDGHNRLPTRLFSQTPGGLRWPGLAGGTKSHLSKKQPHETPPGEKCLRALALKNGASRRALATSPVRRLGARLLPEPAKACASSPDGKTPGKPRFGGGSLRKLSP